MMPARRAAQNGCMKRFVLSWPNARRKNAPAPALTKISAATGICWTPKITANATAPDAAASANSHVGAGHAGHLHARRIGRDLGRQHALLVIDQKLQRTPARDKARAQPQRPSQTLGRAHGLFGGLSVDVEKAGKIKDQSRSLIGSHRSFSKTCAGLPKQNRYRALAAESAT